MPVPPISSRRLRAVERLSRLRGVVDGVEEVRVGLQGMLMSAWPSCFET